MNIQGDEYTGKQELAVVRCHVVSPFCICIDSVQVTCTISASVVSATYLAVIVYHHMCIVQHVSTLSTTIDRAFHKGRTVDGHRGSIEVG